jgi:hypothetical protein
VRCLDTGINCPFPFTNKTCIHTIQPTETATNYLVKLEYISLTKQQFLMTHIIRQTEILALLYNWVTNTPSVKIMCTRKNSSSLHCHKTITCLNVGLLRISHKFFFLSPVIPCIDGLQQTAVSWVICYSLSGFWKKYITFLKTLVLKCCTNATASIIMFACTLVCWYVKNMNLWKYFHKFKTRDFYGNSLIQSNSS